MAARITVDRKDSRESRTHVSLNGRVGAKSEKTKVEATSITEEISAGGNVSHAITCPTGGPVVDFDIAVWNRRYAAVDL